MNKFEDWSLLKSQSCSSTLHPQIDHQTPHLFILCYHNLHFPSDIPVLNLIATKNPATVTVTVTTDTGKLPVSVLGDCTKSTGLMVLSVIKAVGLCDIFFPAHPRASAGPVVVWELLLYGWAKKGEGTCGWRGLSKAQLCIKTRKIWLYWLYVTQGCVKDCHTSGDHTYKVWHVENGFFNLYAVYYGK